jgi:hypothetical protein
MRSFYPFLLAVAMGASELPLSIHQNSTPASQTPQPQAQEQNSQEPAASSGTKRESQESVIQEKQPVTVKLNNGAKLESADPVMGVPPLPKGKTSLIGGRVIKIDGIRNQMSVKVFDGGKWNVAFDERTHFFRDGVATTFAHVKKGDQVYVDTMLDGHRIFARNIRVVTHLGTADARGQVLSFHNDNMSMRDDLSAQAVNFRVSHATEVLRDGQRASVADLQPGSLISVKFLPGDPDGGMAKEITLLASPGQEFTFEGKVTHLDLSTGALSVENRADSRIYDLTFDRHGSIPSRLMVGTEVRVAAIFDGRHYRANQINVTGTNSLGEHR